jgi:ABC-type metal ion transport system substrate-binding protein
MQITRRTLFAITLAIALGPGLAASQPAFAKDPRELVICTSAGPYADQVKYGVKPLLERQGYKVKVVEKVVELSDYAQPNFALASGLKLTEALRTEKISRNYVNLVAVRTADLQKSFARDIAAAYRSRAFLAWTEQHNAGYAKTDYQLAMLAQKTP